MPSCNTTLEDLHIVEDPLWKDYTFHHFGLALGAVFGLISVVLSLYLIFQHALHYQKPKEQKHIIRILFMIPVYSVVSFLSFLFYRKAIYFQVLRDCYEAFAISSFFALLCHYVAPDLHEQKVYFRTITPQNWFWKVFGLQSCTGGENKGPFRKPRSGLTWFNVIWVGIFQYCFVRVLFTIVSVVAEAFGRYCEASLSPAFAHIWVTVLEALSVTVAMFMVVQFYLQLKNDLAEHKPGIKVVSIKLVIFFSFWQTLVISFLSSARGPLQPTRHLAYQDIKIGIPSVLLIIEMAFFAVLHIFAYPWKPYSHRHTPKDPFAPAEGPSDESTPHYEGGFMGLRAIGDAFNPWDIIKDSARGFRWLFVGRRNRHADASYYPAKPDYDDTSYMNPSSSSAAHARPGGATELHPTPTDTRGRRPPGGESDTAGLLRNSQFPHESSPPRYDAGRPTQPARPASPYYRAEGQAPPPPSTTAYYPPTVADPGFHPGMGPPPGSSIPVGRNGEVHPTHRGVPPSLHPGGEWNHWGGVETRSRDGGDYDDVDDDEDEESRYAGRGGERWRDGKF